MPRHDTNHYNLVKSLVENPERHLQQVKLVSLLSQTPEQKLSLKMFPQGEASVLNDSKCGGNDSPSKNLIRQIY